MATSDIVAIVQSAPDVAAGDSSWVASLVAQAQATIAAFCNLPAFPVQSPGISRGAADAAEDLRALSDNQVLVALNGSAPQSASVTLSACATGLAAAAELQRAVRAVAQSAGAEPACQWDGVAVTFETPAKRYVLMSSLLGENSILAVTFDPARPVLARALRLSPAFGGEETPGTPRVPMLEAVCAQIALEAYRATSLAPETYDDSSAFVARAAESLAATLGRYKGLLTRFRRLTL